MKRYWDAVAGRPWLHVIERHVYGVPDHLREIDPNLFLVRNVKKGQWEVHDASVPIPALTFVLAADDLDSDIQLRLWAARRENDPFGEAERWAQAERAASDRRVEDAARGTAEELADLASEKVVVPVN